MKTYFLEAIILYMVLFFPATLAATPESFAFSINQELTRIFIYDVPALALIWYLLLKTGSGQAVRTSVGRRRAFFTFLFTLSGLLLVSAGVVILSLGVTMTSAPAALEVPDTLSGWLVVLVSCLSTGYVEESYFRYYLLKRLEGLNVYWLGLFSSTLFAFCHVYEGSLGVLNAFLAGCLLFLVLVKRNSLHAIAAAHGVYNFLVYVLS